MPTLPQMGEPFVRVELPPLTQYKPCNPSIVRVRDGYVATMRGCNYDLKKGYHFTIGSAPSQTPDSQNYIFRLNDKLEIHSSAFLEDRHIRADVRALDGVEDLRLFSWRGDLYVLGSALNYTPKPKNTMVLCRVEGERLVDPVFIPSPIGAAIEKNWMPCVRGDDLLFLHWLSPFGLYLYDKGLAPVACDAPLIELPEGLSGSSCIVPYGNGWLAVVHRKTFDKREYTYRHHLVEFDRALRPVRIGRKFSFENDHIEFCAGLSLCGATVVFSYGVLDQRAVILKMDASILEKLL